MIETTMTTMNDEDLKAAAAAAAANAIPDETTQFPLDMMSRLVGDIAQEIAPSPISFLSSADEMCAAAQMLAKAQMEALRAVCARIAEVCTAGVYVYRCDGA